MLDMASNEAEKTLVETHSDLNVLDTVRDDICNMIYVIRGKQVMIDSNLAMLYHVETKVFNQSVKRNANRFPDGFRFQLNQDEYDSLRSQIVTSKKKKAMRWKKVAEDICHMFLLSRELQCYQLFLEAMLL